MEKTITYTNVSKVLIKLNRQDLLAHLGSFLEQECPNYSTAKLVSVFVCEKEHDEEIEISSAIDNSGAKLCFEFKFEESKSE